jgi:enoyl-CoA hydratase/carnithine racemase
MAGKVHTEDPAPGVRRLTFANDGKRGALDHAILDGLAEEIRAAEADDSVRCLILTGSDGSFSSGYDIGELTDDEFEVEAERLVAHPYTSAIEALDSTPLPTVAELGGHAIGGGLELAVACDFRIASREIKLGMPPAKLGLVYSHTGLARFLRLIGEGRTRELFLIGDYIDAPTAIEWGLVTRLGSAEDALSLATDLAANAPLSISGNKAVLRSLLAADHGLSPADTERLIKLRQACFASADLREGVRAFGEKRPARWSGT